MSDTCCGGDCGDTASATDVEFVDVTDAIYRDGFHAGFNEGVEAELGSNSRLALAHAVTWGVGLSVTHVVEAAKAYREFLTPDCAESVSTSEAYEHGYSDGVRDAQNMPVLVISHDDADAPIVARFTPGGLARLIDFAVATTTFALDEELRADADAFLSLAASVV